MLFVTESFDVLKLGTIGALGGASLAALSLMLVPTIGASAQKAPPARLALSDGIVSSFTPSVADPRLAAAFARRGFQSGSIRFTPTSASSNKSKAVRVAIRARATPSTDTARSGAVTSVAAITPTAYNLGAAVGWKRFAISGDVARVENGAIPGLRDAAEVGVSYSGSKFAGRVEVGAERAEGAQRLVAVDSSYSLDVGGSYRVARNLDLTGGVRYKIQRDRLEPLSDERRDSQAVYIGTAFRF